MSPFSFILCLLLDNLSSVDARNTDLHSLQTVSCRFCSPLLFHLALPNGLPQGFPDCKLHHAEHFCKNYANPSSLESLKTLAGSVNILRHSCKVLLCSLYQRLEPFISLSWALLSFPSDRALVFIPLFFPLIFKSWVHLF